MPIISPVRLKAISQEEFARLDYRVMRHAFDCHNKLGRLCDEVIYQSDFAARLESAGFGPIRKEVQITLTHGDFRTVYSLDLAVADNAVYELKTARGLIPDHEAQLLNYLLLVNLQHGKLINFRPEQLESRFINTTLTYESQREFKLDFSRWRETDERTRFFRTALQELLADWGCFLEISVYIAALVHFLGGEANVLKQVPLSRAGILLGNQAIHLLTPDIAFKVTAITDQSLHYEKHLRLMLRHSGLSAIQWVNVARHQIEFVSLLK